MAGTQPEEGAHSSTSTMKEATGMARITFTAGVSTQSAARRAEVAAATRAPTTAPTAKPPKIRPRVTAADCQKAPCPARAHSRWATSRG